MLLCRYINGSESQFGLVEDGTVFSVVGNPFFESLEKGDRVGPVDRVRLLPPVVPSKIVCVGRNYEAHAREKGNEVPTEPLLFFKPPSSVIGHIDAIELKKDVGLVEHEAELAVIIGTIGRNISRDNATKYIFGYTCANDVSARDFQAKDGQWARAKGFDTFCPLGPWINTSLEPSDVRVQCFVNGNIRQDATTKQLVFDIPFLVSHISTIMTLMPGDVILTGTPAGVGPISDGDQVEVEIGGIGILKNPVIVSS